MGYEVVINMVSTDVGEPNTLFARCTIRGISVGVRVEIPNQSFVTTDKEEMIREAAIARYEEMVTTGIENNCSIE